MLVGVNRVEIDELTLVDTSREGTNTREKV
jgi:hypothetical protein